MPRKYLRSASKDVKSALHKRKSGTLKSGRSGKTVKSRKQAIAIGLSEARKGQEGYEEKKQVAGSVDEERKMRPMTNTTDKNSKRRGRGGASAPGSKERLRPPRTPSKTENAGSTKRITSKKEKISPRFQTTKSPRSFIETRINRSGGVNGGTGN